LLVLFVASAVTFAADDPALIDSMDTVRFRGDKGKMELVDGKVGKAVRFDFPDKCQSVFFSQVLRGKPEWDETEGFSFWVKGDGSDHFGGLQFIYADDYAVRYDYMFPIKSTEWTKISVAWDELIPVLPGPKSMPLSSTTNRPSKLSALFVGKWWYWRDYAAHSYAIDQIHLEEKIERDAKDYRPAGAALARTLAKLRDGKPITIVTMGDSLTDTVHWANREVVWPALLKKQIEAKYQLKVTIVNPALGGTQLRQNVVLIPRWVAQAPEADLVTVCFGGNDWEGGMRGPQFTQANEDAIDRIRRATKGKADVLILSTVPSVEMWATRDELGEACRKAASARNAGLADAEKAFHEAGKTDRAKLFCSDKVHLGPVGHELMAKTVLEAIEAAKRD
jgi:lysophospholipase L1-like esterase